jgi:hypothetical protein
LNGFIVEKNAEVECAKKEVEIANKKIDLLILEKNSIVERLNSIVKFAQKDIECLKTELNHPKGKVKNEGVNGEILSYCTSIDATKAFIKAASEGDVEAIRTYLNNGIDIDSKDDKVFFKTFSYCRPDST